MPTRIAPNILAVGKCLYIEDMQALIIADIHLGYEEHLAKKGVFIPRLQYDDVIRELESSLERVPVKVAILNGDVKHEFGTISRQEWREVTRLVKFLRDKGVEVVAVKGNHDTIFGPLARKLKIREVKEIRHKDILIAHGDYVPDKLEDFVLIGHEHPAITLRDESKSEKFKCFVKVPFNNSAVICQPSFNPVTIGTDITSEKLLSPLLKNIKKAEVFIVDEKSGDVLPFGKTKEL